jgi:hypothetical protein
MPQISKAVMLASLALLVALPASVARADTELLELRNTILNLVDELVKQGVISAEKADDMKRQAALKAREQAAQADIAAGKAGEAPPAGAGSAVVRVPYVPEFVKDEIRAEVREELRDEVTQDVVAVAKAEKWGTADALPEWVSRVKFSGDIRLRGNGVYYEDGNNPTVPDFQAINEAGGPAAAGEDVFLNSTEDTQRGQVRLRMGLEASPSESFSVVTRLATGDDIDPTTRNQRLGDYNQPFDVFLDLAYLEWRSGERSDSGLWTLRGGRLVNPFQRTSLVFDDDLTFDGFTASYRGAPINRGQTVFANAGGFALLAEEANPLDGGTNDKYWWGFQGGVDVDITENLAFIFAAAYYDFINVVGERNEFDSTSKDWTAPAFIAKGNTVFDIRNDNDPDTQLFALASDFELLNAMFELDYRRFDPVHVVLRGDFVRNLGFEKPDVANRVRTSVEEQSRGWFAELEVGYPDIRAAGDWTVFGGYKYLQRDAILDSFADSDFHAGGTDAEGWIAGASIGLSSNVWVRARWLSADEIDGAPAGFAAPFEPLAIDLLQIDLNARF